MLRHHYRSTTTVNDEVFLTEALSVSGVSPVFSHDIRAMYNADGGGAIFGFPSTDSIFSQSPGEASPDEKDVCVPILPTPCKQDLVREVIDLISDDDECDNGRTATTSCKSSPVLKRYRYSSV